MKKTKSYQLVSAKVNGGYTIMVYGELTEDTTVSGYVITPVEFSRNGERVMEVSAENVKSLLTGKPYAKTKKFNMGWAVCSPLDVFSEEKGIEICKSRFHSSPLTTQSGTFLTNDMIYAILRNEIEYIKSHWDEFVPPVKPASDDDIIELELEAEENEPESSQQQKEAVSKKKPAEKAKEVKDTIDVIPNKFAVVDVGNAEGVALIHNKITHKNGDVEALCDIVTLNAEDDGGYHMKSFNFQTNVIVPAGSIVRYASDKDMKKFAEKAGLVWDGEKLRKIYNPINTLVDWGSPWASWMHRLLF